FLPIVFGSSIQVKPVRISADGASQRLDAYATTLGTQFGTGGVQAWYAKDNLGAYRQISSAASTTTHLYGNNLAKNLGWTDPGTSNEMVRGFTTSTSTYITTNGICIMSYAVASPAGYVDYAIYDSDGPAGLMGTRLAKARVAASTFSGIGDKTFRFSFDK